MDIAKPSITRITRKAGIKTLSDDCYDTIRSIIQENIQQIINIAIIVNSEYNTKTLMTEHIYEAIYILGHNVAKSTDLNTNTTTK